jgi:membrane fusion protein (multidrug efflux system)
LATLLGCCGCKKPAPAALPSPVVQVMDLQATNAPLSAEFIGQVDSPQNVEVRARVEAFVDKMLFIEGTEVTEGAPLFKLDDSPYQERFAAAKGAQAEAEAALKKYEADVARLRPLAEKRAVPQQDLDNALASVEVGQANVVSAKARVQSAQLDLDYCDVRAPISGLIGAKQASIGELVGKGQPTLLATISTLDPMWFYCNVSEVDIIKADAEARRTGRRAADAPLTLLLADGSEHVAKGRFVFLDRAVDVKTGTLRLRAEFANPSRPTPAPTNSLLGGTNAAADRLLRPGMFGRIRLDLGVRPDSILVPERAVQELQGKNFVMVVGSDNKVAQRPVTVGRQIGGSLLITEGLKAGERIVIEGLQKVRDGLEVNPKTAAELAAVAQQAEAKQPKAAAAQHGKEAEAKQRKE